MTQRQVHVIGAGLAGLSAALQLALSGEKVTIYEAAPFAGGRCRSFLDRDLGCRIDNGNHLVLSGNTAVQDYLFLTNALDTVTGPGEPLFPFVDFSTGERWTIKMSKGAIPWWIFDKKRRIPGTKALDYLSAAKIMSARENDTLAGLVNPNNALYKRFWEPLIIGSLNTEPEIASARLLRNVLAQSFGAGGRACVPIIPKIGLSETFVIPCLNALRDRGADIKYYQRLRAILWEGDVVRELVFNGASVELGPHDWVVLALPAWILREILPEVMTPMKFRSIISAHFRIDGASIEDCFTGVIGGYSEWIFVKSGVISTTISCADRYKSVPVREMAALIWEEVAALFQLDPDLVPQHRIFLEKFATIASTPDQNRIRPPAYTGWKNVAIAGEWTATGLPTTIEGALRSGMKAAQVVVRWK